MFLVSISPPNIWKVLENEEDDGYYMDTKNTEINDCDLSEILIYLIYSY